MPFSGLSTPPSPYGLASQRWRTPLVGQAGTDHVPWGVKPRDVTWGLGEGAEKAPVSGSGGRHWVPRPLACHLLQDQRQRGESRAAWPHPLHQTLQLRRHAWPQFPHLLCGKRAQMGTSQDPATGPNSALTVLGPSLGPGQSVHSSTPIHPQPQGTQEPLPLGPSTQGSGSLSTPRVDPVPP